jgi:hypothetical protein
MCAAAAIFSALLMVKSAVGVCEKIFCVMLYSFSAMGQWQYQLDKNPKKVFSQLNSLLGALDRSGMSKSIPIKRTKRPPYGRLSLLKSIYHHEE